MVVSVGTAVGKLDGDLVGLVEGSLVGGEADVI